VQQTRRAQSKTKQHSLPYDCSTFACCSSLFLSDAKFVTFVLSVCRLSHSMVTFPVSFVAFRTRRLSDSSMASSDSSSGFLSDLGLNGAIDPSYDIVADTSDSSALCLPVKSVWDFENVKRLGDSNTKSTQSWVCGWCSSTFKSWNATKALNHVSKASGKNDIKPCTGAIPKKTLTMFQNFRLQTRSMQAVKRKHKDEFIEQLSNNQTSISCHFEHKKIRSSKTSNASQPINMTAIADFVFSKGLSFSVTEGEHFQQILQLSRLVPSSYRAPNRKSLSNDLLDISYENTLQKYMGNLEIDSEVFGISLFGDGATVHGMPLMNILASGVVEPSAVLAIVDCKLVDCC
jgi:hypothetical protein